MEKNRGGEEVYQLVDSDIPSLFPVSLPRAYWPIMGKTAFRPRR